MNWWKNLWDHVAEDYPTSKPVRNFVMSYYKGETIMPDQALSRSFMSSIESIERCINVFSFDEHNKKDQWLNYVYRVMGTNIVVRCTYTYYHKQSYDVRSLLVLILDRNGNENEVIRYVTGSDQDYIVNFFGDLPPSNYVVLLSNIVSKFIIPDWLKQESEKVEAENGERERRRLLAIKAQEEIASNNSGINRLLTDTLDKLDQV